jgi:thiopeptide-type bacteriocin biosynthesis protein
LSLVSASRGVGTTIGRFIGLLEQSDQERAASVFAQLPASDPETVPAQLSFPPLDPGNAHVTRTPELLSAVISMAEHRRPSDAVIGLEDLAVACDRRRLYLASLSRRQRLEPTVLHALDLRRHTPPLARFLSEVSRAQAAVVSGFSWGAASHLPFLPRVRYGRTIVSPARWRLDRSELPGRGAPWPEWQEAMTALRARRYLPTMVFLTEGDRLLNLDLDQSFHLVLLRAHLQSAQHTVLTEAPSPGAYGWFGGHAHEIIVPMTAAQPSRWPAVPPITATRVVGRDHGHLPGTSTWLHAKLYGHRERQAEILAQYLPELLAKWDEEPAWWYMRYRDPEWHLRLRIALPNASEFGLAAGRVSAWAWRLRRQGLLRDLQFATSYPETGRWGTGAVMAAAEEVFGADSRALAVQFAQSPQPHPQVLAAAHFVAIAAAFTGSTEAGMEWLITYAKTETSSALPHDVLAEAVRLADPADNWAALRAVPGGQAITQVWEPRHRSLATYRIRLQEADGISPDAVLDSLLHAHHIRAVGIDRDDERTCMRLARAAALAWKAHRAYNGNGR